MRAASAAAVAEGRPVDPQAFLKGLEGRLEAVRGRHVVHRPQGRSLYQNRIEAANFDSHAVLAALRVVCRRASKPIEAMIAENDGMAMKWIVMR